MYNNLIYITSDLADPYVGNYLRNQIDYSQ